MKPQIGVVAFCPPDQRVEPHKIAGPQHRGDLGILVDRLADVIAQPDAAARRSTASMLVPQRASPVTSSVFSAAVRPGSGATRAMTPWFR